MLSIISVDWLLYYAASAIGSCFGLVVVEACRSLFLSPKEKEFHRG